VKSEIESDGFDDFGNFDDPKTDNKPDTTPTEVLDQNIGAQSDSFDDFGTFNEPLTETLKES